MVKHFSSFCLIFCLFLPLMLKADFERAVRPLRNGTLVLRRASWCWTSTALIRTQQHRSRKSPSEPDSGRRQRRNIWYPDGSICRFYEGTVIMPAAAVSHSRFSIRSVFIRRSVSFAIAPGESGAAVGITVSFHAEKCRNEIEGRYICMWASLFQTVLCLCQWSVTITYVC